MRFAQLFSSLHDNDRCQEDEKLTKSHEASLDLPGGVSNISGSALKSLNAIQTLPAWVLGAVGPGCPRGGDHAFPGVGGGNRDPALV